jgi:ATP-dependent DNA helicase RecG
MLAEITSRRDEVQAMQATGEGAVERPRAESRSEWWRLRSEWRPESVHHRIMLANAIYHRSYEEREPVEVRISAEELVVLSYPGPDRSVRLEQLRAGRALPCRYRNRRIGEFLKELEITEGRSTGIPKILDAMKRNGSPPPEFEFDDDHSYFMTRLPIHRQVRRGASTQVTAQVTAQVAGQVAGQVSPEVQRLLEVLQGEMMRLENQERLSLKGRANFEERYSKPAIEAGFIELTIPNKPRSRLQKYRLTSKGSAWLATHAKSGANH